MMASSLVADYTSSGSDSGSDSDSETETENQLRSSDCGTKKQQNLLRTRDSSSSSDSDSDTERAGNSTKKRHRPSPRDDDFDSSSKLPLPLPLPGVFGSSEPTGRLDNLPGQSVFANPFEIARQEELSILERHVKLKEQEKLADWKDKRICFKFQKGKCRFGDTCKFRHPGSQRAIGQEGEQGTNPGHNAGYMGPPHGGGFYPCGDDEQEVVDEDETVRRKRKDRAGLSETLVPSRKALKIYDRQRHQERPWTAKR